MRRIFIAVKVVPGGNLRRMISSFKTLLAGENIKWVDAENIHVTLAFIGDTDEEKVEIVSSLLQVNCTDFGGFEFILKGAGVFKNFREPGAIWIGIQSSDNFHRLNDRIKSDLNNNGFKIEERPFKPHLTIGRVKFLKSQTNLKTILEKCHDVEIQRVYVREVILYESILRPTGPIYKPVSIIKLE